MSLVLNNIQFLILIPSQVYHLSIGQLRKYKLCRNGPVVAAGVLESDSKGGFLQFFWFSSPLLTYRGSPPLVGFLWWGFATHAMPMLSNYKGKTEIDKSRRSRVYRLRLVLTRHQNKSKNTRKRDTPIQCVSLTKHDWSCLFSDALSSHPTQSWGEVNPRALLCSGGAPRTENSTDRGLSRGKRNAHQGAKDENAWHGAGNAAAAAARNVSCLDAIGDAPVPRIAGPIIVYNTRGQLEGQRTLRSARE